jgi:4-amino-4-deoxy-L-arabinose transferase-like glycosyltransferase
MIFMANMFPPKFKHFLPLVVILAVYFIIRLQNLQSIPVFGDEAIYLRWSQLIKNVDTLRFVPLSDGKQPLFMWITAVFYKFVSDPLVAGRLLSVFSGAFTIVVLYIFSLIFLSFPVAVFSCLVYIILPFTFFFDRLALPDNLLSFFGVLSMLFAFLLAKHPRLDLSIILGTVLGLAWLTKSPAVYFLVLSLITFLIYDRNNLSKIFYPVISSVIGFFIYNILRLGPQFSQIAIRNRDYLWSFSEIIKHPLDPFLPHLRDIINIYGSYISLPLMIIGIMGIIFYLSHRRGKHPIFLISLWWILPLIANAMIARVFTARYILFTVPPLVLLLSFGVHHFFRLTHGYFHSRYSQALFLVICFAFNLFWIYRLSFNPFTVNLSSTETGYLSGWTSGWGIKEASGYLVARSKTANVIVGTEGYFGTLPDGLEIYTDSLKNLTVFGVGIDLTDIPAKLLDARNHGDEVYLLFNQSRLKLTPSQQNNVTLVNRYQKPGNDYLLLYRLN